MTNEPFDDSTKAFYRKLFEQWGLFVETEREVFFRGRAIDLVVTCTEDDQNRLQNTVFSHFRHLNAIELKGINDPLTLIDYNRIMMRVWGLGAIESEEEQDSESESEKALTTKPHEISELSRFPDQRTVTMVCVTRPNKILDQLQKRLKFYKTNESGIYHCEAPIQQWIIHPTELALVERNYPLLPLARGKKLAQFIALCLEQKRADYLQLILDVGLFTDPYTIWQKILEIKKMQPQIPDEAWPYMDRYLQSIPQNLWKLPTFDQALEKSQQRGQQRAIIRQLRRKFKQIPNSVVQKIEATDDQEQLDQWLDLVIEANSLTEMGLSEPHN
jgi:hypothetical protein